MLNKYANQPTAEWTSTLSEVPYVVQSLTSVAFQPFKVVEDGGIIQAMENSVAR